MDLLSANDNPAIMVWCFQVGVHAGSCVHVTGSSVLALTTLFVHWENIVVCIDHNTFSQARSKRRVAFTEVCSSDSRQ